MLIPLVGFTESGEPLLSPRITGDDGAGVMPLEVVRRLGLASPIFLCMPSTVLAAPPSPALTEHMLEGNCIVGPFSFERADEAREWLSSGAKYALFMPPELAADSSLAAMVKGAAAEVAIPAERLILLMRAPLANDAVAVARFFEDVQQLAAPTGAGCYECCRAEKVGVVSGIALMMPAGSTPAGESELLALLGPVAARDRLQVMIGGLSSRTAASIGHIYHSYTIHAIEMASLSDMSSSAEPPPLPPLMPAGAEILAPLFGREALDLGPCVAACLRTDRSDGLFPTLVLEADGAALGIVYSSTASISAALACGRGVYWSRSRQSLWRKGDTSGAWQTLRRIRLDCDCDALCFTVTQHGEPPAFCHKTTLSCFGAPDGLQALQLVLASRKQSAPPGSYTKRLSDDPEFLRNKLVEEAQELAEAVEPDHVITARMPLSSSCPRTIAIAPSCSLFFVPLPLVCRLRPRLRMSCILQWHVVWRQA